ncbi:uncharacterized protein LOC135482194 [Liolophura sinensis]|uniref:uncharacterized protein LOC135482194 n=1 Tax=Liolophura sinensis TaxID=3198878 RepID=UPI003158EF43
MATTPSSNLHDATLSKTLIEAKHRLGSVYFEARLIECPKNAIELKKLLKKYDFLEREYLKQVIEVNRGQQMLSLSLTNYLKAGRPLSSQEIFSHSRSHRLTLPLPPGFRFRSNGESKQVQLKSVPTEIDGQKCWKNTNQWRKRQYALLNSVLRDTQVIKTTSNEDTVGDSDKSSADESKSVITKDSKTGKSLCNSRFAFKPGSINFGKSTGKILKQRRCTRSSLRPACSACQFKLKYSDEGLQKIQHTQKEPLRRWQIPPKGIYVQAPFNFNELNKIVRAAQGCKGSDISSEAELTQTFPVGRGDGKTDENLKKYPARNGSDAQRLASSAALTSILHRAKCEKTRRIPSINALVKDQLNYFGERRSSVSFSPSATNSSTVEPASQQMVVSGSYCVTSPSLRRGRTMSRLRHLSVDDWRPILEEERKRCAFNVERFLEKLPGSYIQKVKSKDPDLLPWARSKD